MVYINEYKDTTGLDFLRSAELEIVQIPDIG
jgi:hypothetical protein